MFDDGDVQVYCLARERWSLLLAEDAPPAAPAGMRVTGTSAHFPVTPHSRPCRNYCRSGSGYLSYEYQK